MEMQTVQCTILWSGHSIKKYYVRAQMWTIENRVVALATISMRYCTAACCYWWVYLRNSILCSNVPSFFFVYEIFASARTLVHSSFVDSSLCFFFLHLFSPARFVVIFEKGVLCRYFDCVFMLFCSTRMVHVQFVVGLTRLRFVFHTLRYASKFWLSSKR